MPNDNIISKENLMVNCNLMSGDNPLPRLIQRPKVNHYLVSKVIQYPTVIH